MIQQSEGSKKEGQNQRHVRRTRTDTGSYVCMYICIRLSCIHTTGSLLGLGLSHERQRSTVESSVHRPAAPRRRYVHEPKKLNQEETTRREGVPQPS